MKEIRLLTSDEIDCRVAQTTAYNGVVKVNLLLYKDARVDMKILDELYGTMGWKRSHQLIGDRLYCTIEVWDADKKEWVAKQDVGTESNTEPEKGQASDAFKRAGFNWGIGRELYTAPKVQITLNEKEYRENQGRYQVWAKFYVKTIAYDTAERTITRLVIVDEKGSIRYEYGNRKEVSKNQTYWLCVRNYVEGKLSKSGDDYKTAWIRELNPSEEAIKQFDLDCADYRETLNASK